MRSTAVGGGIVFTIGGEAGEPVTSTMTRILHFRAASAVFIGLMLFVGFSCNKSRRDSPTTVAELHEAGWKELCRASSPAGSSRAIVWNDYIKRGLEGRHHYYLSFDPPMRGLMVPTISTLKQTSSAEKKATVESGWRFTHYMGYLQDLDDVKGRRPSLAEWNTNGIITVRSEKGTVSVYRSAMGRPLK